MESSWEKHQSQCTRRQSAQNNMCVKIPQSLQFYVNALCWDTHVYSYQCAHTCIHASAHMHTHTSAHTCIHTSAHMYIHISTHVHLHAHKQGYIHAETHIKRKHIKGLRKRRHYILSVVSPSLTFHPLMWWCQEVRPLGKIILWGWGPCEWG